MSLLLTTTSLGAGAFGVQPWSPAMASGLPTGAAIATGDGGIDIDGHTMTVQQLSDRLGIDWHEFSIGPDKTVVFEQPSATAAALNRVTGGSPSEILGSLRANGAVFLVNPNGIVFGAGSQVDVGSLAASTLDLGHDDFQAGNYVFEGDSGEAIVNLGEIRAADGGTVALVAAQIENQGAIEADQGDVLLGAGSRVRLDMGGPVSLEVEESAVDALIEQGGAVRADGGRVIMEAQGAADVAASVINHTGVTEARTLETGEDGEILLQGGMETDRIEIGGQLDASAPDAGDGGFIETSAARVDIDQDVHVTTEADQGQSGEWLIDPTDIEIVSGPNDGDLDGPSSIHNATIETALNTTDVTIETIEAGGGDGRITVDAPIAWSSGNTLTLSAHSDIEINEVIDASAGAGGRLALHFGQATADGGDSRYIVDHIGGNGRIDLQPGQNFSIRKGNTGTVVDFNVITELGDAGDEGTGALTLQGLAHGSNLAGNFVLGADIDASDTASWNGGDGFAPIGPNSNDSFDGTFDGLGHTISGLAIDSTNTYVALFGYSLEADIRHLGLADASITSTGSAIAGLVGYANASEISHIFVDGTVEGNSFVGGITSYADNTSTRRTTITHSYSTMDVTGQGDGIGGLVGYAKANSIIQRSFATGSVSGASNVGGLVGLLEESSVIEQSYASGTVDGDGNLGGLLGNADAGAEIIQSYATGLVNDGDAGAGIGGLVGNAVGITIQQSYWDREKTGQDASAGVDAAYGLTSAAMQEAASFDDWDVTDAQDDGSTWRLYEGQSTPLLRDFMTPATGTVGARAYDGTAAIDVAELEFGATSDAGTLPIVGGTFESADAGSDKSVTLTFDPDADDLSAQLQFHDLAVTGTTDRREITISGFSAEDRVYDGTNEATVTPGTIAFDNLIGSETLDVDDAAASFDQNNAGTAIGVTLDAVTLADGDNGGKVSNYELTPGTPTTTADIQRRMVSIDGLDVADKTYDGTAAANVGLGSVAFSNLVGDETLNVADADAAFTETDAGTDIPVDLTDLTLADGGNGGLASNYQVDLGSAPTASADISRRQVTVAGFAAKDRVYDGTNEATVAPGTIAFDNLIGSETLDVDNAAASFDQNNAGTAIGVTLDAVTLANGDNGGKASNYELDLGTPATIADIQRRMVSIDGFEVADKTYDGTAAASVGLGSVAFSNLVGDETLNVADADAAFTETDAGTDISVDLTDLTLADGGNGGLASNYQVDLGSAPTASADISRRPISIAADDQQRPTDAADPPFTFEITAGNLVGTDTLSGTLTRPDGSAPGTYPIQLGSLDNPNYLITFAEGALTIADPTDPDPAPPDHEPTPPADASPAPAPAADAAPEPSPSTPADSVAARAQAIIAYMVDQARGMGGTDDGISVPEGAPAAPTGNDGTGFTIMTVINDGVNFGPNADDDGESNVTGTEAVFD